MCDKSCKSNGKQLCLDSTCCLPHQVTSENSSNNIGENSKDLESLAYHQHVKSNTTFLHAVINMIGMLIGLGQLSTPYALENGGWMSSIILIGLGIICAYTSHLLGKCLQKNPKSKDYKDIGHQAFGTKGRIIVTSFIYLEIFMALISYTISLHDNLSIVFINTNLKLKGILFHLSTSQILTTIAILIAIPTLWLRNFSSISFLSSGGIFMSLLIFVTVACTAIFGGIKANHQIPFLHLQNIPSISGLYIFSYAGHIVFPNIYTAMKDPSKFTKVSIVSFSLVTTLYISLGFMGAKLFGPQVSSQITLSMPHDQIITKFALWATILTPMTKYALEFAPIAIELEENLPSSMKSKVKMMIRGIVGSILLLVILILALSVPYFEHVLSLTGSLVGVGICVIFPCAFYTKIFWGEISRMSLILNVVLIVIGGLLGVVGTISSSKLLAKSLKRAHDST
ncbi:amino acid transporter AVT1H [Solanum verrucosum]|uniref:amino acid transporter AVT1H n=1 Tax=Solanum verrucosum TaxID=315347 RepID=UPI0020D1F35E|nr:amino acid transporter AVT1H [Solanum verrucosum]